VKLVVVWIANFGDQFLENKFQYIGLLGKRVLLSFRLGISLQKITFGLPKSKTRFVLILVWNFGL
jgi:hypothetical protein